jgi:hypothetical protein
MQCKLCGKEIKYNCYAIAACRHFGCQLSYYDPKWISEKDSRIIDGKDCLYIIFNFRNYAIDNDKLKLYWQYNDWYQLDISYLQKRSIEKGIYNLDDLKKFLDNIDQYDYKEYLEDVIDYTLLER